MMFWFKRKQIVVDCFTTLRGAYELYKPDNSIKFFPKEVKTMQNYYDTIDPTTKITKSESTIRKCAGLIDYYKIGFILPMWTDFICQPKSAVAKETALGLISSPYYFSSHSKKQYSGMFDGYMHLKLDSPWKFKENTDIKFIWTSPTWNLHRHLNNFSIVPAALSFKYQCTTNVHMFVNASSENFTINSGTPLVHLSPITEKKVVLKYHLVDEKELNKIGIPSDFNNIKPERYKRWVDESKKHESKCPFEFKKL
jgi:hypothetical protein